MFFPFAADHQRGAGLGKRPTRLVGCHAWMVQSPSNGPLPDLGQASLVLSLMGVPAGKAVLLHKPIPTQGIWVLDDLFLFIKQDMGSVRVGMRFSSKNQAELDIITARSVPAPYRM